MSCGLRSNRLLPTVSLGCKNSMADGRVFTDWNPNCVLNQDLRMMANLRNSRDYRQFLQHNGNQLIDRDRKIAFQNSFNYCKCNTPYQVAAYNLNT